ncbi:hypothetical protein CY34DRAFT_813185 [Suillus luteus UH-Slu-Lm8-n1]|uniref:Uncharacterized protein n=1 Tax=Suillus luteus UH-Slu-Lm8-n1 TaxID=930992 RepID=A0A0D0AIJ4_9AGAM|nr:hypothetical protein CY34DRAFT_813185 [Suillus luteus UH-Slu-Lm8-n1]
MGCLIRAMFVFVVNLGAYKSMYIIISGALCVAIIVKVIHDKFGIENVFMSTIRAVGITDIKAVTNNITPKYSEGCRKNRSLVRLQAHLLMRPSLTLIVNVKSSTCFGAITTYERSRCASCLFLIMSWSLRTCLNALSRPSSILGLHARFIRVPSSWSHTMPILSGDI